MSKEQVLADISSLIQDIDKCTGEYVAAIASREGYKVNIVVPGMSRLLVAAHQELSFLYDYIKEGAIDDDEKYTGETDCGDKVNVSFPAW